MTSIKQKRGSLGLLTTEMLCSNSVFYIGADEVELNCILKESNIYIGTPDEYLYLNDKMNFYLTVLILDEKPYEYHRHIKKINKNLARNYIKVLFHATRKECIHYTPFEEQRICWIQESDLQMFTWNSKFAYL